MAQRCVVVFLLVCCSSGIRAVPDLRWAFFDGFSSFATVSTSESRPWTQDRAQVGVDDSGDAYATVVTWNLPPLENRPWTVQSSSFYCTQENSQGYEGEVRLYPVKLSDAAHHPSSWSSLVDNENMLASPVASVEKHGQVRSLAFANPARSNEWIDAALQNRASTLDFIIVPEARRTAGAAAGVSELVCGLTLSLEPADQDEECVEELLLRIEMDSTPDPTQIHNGDQLLVTIRSAETGLESREVPLPLTAPVLSMPWLVPCGFGSPSAADFRVQGVSDFSISVQDIVVEFRGSRYSSTHGSPLVLGTGTGGGGDLQAETPLVITAAGLDIARIALHEVEPKVPATELAEVRLFATVIGTHGVTEEFQLAAAPSWTSVLGYAGVTADIGTLYAVELRVDKSRQAADSVNLGTVSIAGLGLQLLGVGYSAVIDDGSVVLDPTSDQECTTILNLKAEEAKTMVPVVLSISAAASSTATQVGVTATMIGPKAESGGHLVTVAASSGATATSVFMIEGVGPAKSIRLEALDWQSLQICRVEVRAGDGVYWTRLPDQGSLALSKDLSLGSSTLELELVLRAPDDGDGEGQSGTSHDTTTGLEDSIGIMMIILLVCMCFAVGLVRHAQEQESREFERDNKDGRGSYEYSWDQGLAYSGSVMAL